MQYSSLQFIMVILFSLVYSTFAIAQTPQLPKGLKAAGTKEKANTPQLPKGLSNDDTATSTPPALPGVSENTTSNTSQPPTLPSGLSAPHSNRDKKAAEERIKSAANPPLNTYFRDHVTGFIDVRGGLRAKQHTPEEDLILGEARLQFEWSSQFRDFYFLIRSDILADEVADGQHVDLTRGTGWLDFREASVSFSPVSFIDIKAGRQILTWGTGDLLFLNDMFPKDWQSFLIGRDVEYLKAPSDAVRVSAYNDLFNLDVVYTPQFDPDRYISGKRASFYQQGFGFRGHDNTLSVVTPDDVIDDAEWAFRLHKTIQGTELALYAYDGFWKSPEGWLPTNNQGFFPALTTYGASIRGLIASGVANTEIAYYDSQDSDGDAPFVPNDQLRYLLAYQRDLPQLSQDLNLGIQYYLEWMLDHDAYARTFPAAFEEADEYRHVLTCRITKQYFQQTLKTSLFTFYSPSDEDAYLRPSITYDIDDQWQTTVGANIFFGEHKHTFYSRFQQNSSVYLGMRYSF